VRLDLRVYSRNVIFLAVYASTDDPDEKGVVRDIGSTIGSNKMITTTYTGRRSKYQETEA